MTYYNIYEYKGFYFTYIKSKLITVQKYNGTEYPLPKIIGLKKLLMFNNGLSERNGEEIPKLDKWILIINPLKKRGRKSEKNTIF